MSKRPSELSNNQLSNLKSGLLESKEKIINAEIGKDKEAYSLNKDELADPVDEAAVNIQASQALRFRNREVMYLKKINKTLDKIDHEDFGCCNDCGCAIGFERLNARPTADMCITCKEESEMMEKSNQFHRKSKSLGKTIQEIGRR
ncbi:MAG: hypothetical protein HN576_08860 [Bacteriovoracaceae bacterium]|nr:hypothetical protein [Bacteriovoracaceae bacterium]